MADLLDFDRVCLVCTNSRERINSNPAGLLTKALDQNGAYLFAGLDHTGLHKGRKDAAALAAQVGPLVRIGADGFKLIEGKPSSRRTLKTPLDDPYYEEFYQAVEDRGLPVLWHVADPEEFWEPGLIPSWAKERGWGYGPGDVPKETLYTETANVLGRHPELKVIFAHFYFLSADLERAANFLEEHPAVGFDLAPGIEMFYNLSKDVEAARGFFVRFADRIFYGTDIFPRLSDKEAKERSGIVRRFLETEDVFRVSEAADFLLGPPEDGEMHGIALPDDVLDKIYHANFERLAGGRPADLDVSAAIEECRRLAAEAEQPDEAVAAAGALAALGS